MSRAAVYTVLAAIISLYAVLGIAYAVQTPAWQSPDEPAHYNYIKYVAGHQALPILQPGDYDQAYNEEFTRTPQQVASMSIAPLRYENYAPPLYYLLAAPIYDLTAGALITLRLVSVFLGGVLVSVTYLIGAEALPDQLPVALGAAAFVAFVPQHLAMLSCVGLQAAELCRRDEVQGGRVRDGWPPGRWCMKRHDECPPCRGPGSPVARRDPGGRCVDRESSPPALGRLCPGRAASAKCRWACHARGESTHPRSTGAAQSVETDTASARRDGPDAAKETDGDTPTDHAGRRLDGAPQPSGPAPGITFAPHGARLFAYIIDSIIVSVVVTVGAFVAVAPVVVVSGADADGGAVPDQNQKFPERMVV